MYLIANATSSFIEIEDLNVSLQPKQAVDLHALGLKDRAEKSVHLKNAKKNGWIKVLRHDKPSKKITKITEKTIEKQSALDPEEILKGIRGIIKEEVKNINQNQQLPEDLVAVLTKIIQANQGNISVSDLTKDDLDFGDGVDLNKLAEIHTKVAEKVMKDTSSSVQYSEESIKDDSMKENLSELEGLL